MPASPSLVTLDQAKDWAKRLAKSKLTVATQAQALEAVAVMLGHASWHALDRYYKNATPVESPASAPDPATEAEPDIPFDKAMERLTAFINGKYPGLKATSVIELAREADLWSGDTHSLRDRIRELEDDGYFPEAALDIAMGEQTSNVCFPPTHLMIRVAQEEGPSMVVLLHADEYAAATGYVSSRKERAAPSVRKPG